MDKVVENKEEITAAYEEVRSDDNELNWCCLVYNGAKIGLDSKGTDFEELKSKFGDVDRVYAFLRIVTGDEMSRRMKFVLLVWVGPNVSAMKKAKMSTDKAFVKKIFTSFANEMMFEDISDVTLEHIKEETMKAGGANYGTGQ